MSKRSKPSITSKDQKSENHGPLNLGGHVLFANGLKDTTSASSSSQVTCVPYSIQRFLHFSGGHVDMLKNSFLIVHLMNDKTSTVKCMDETRVQDVINHVIEQWGPGQELKTHFYSLLAVNETSQEKYWFHRDMLISECQKELGSDQWRYELRIRFFLDSHEHLLRTDRVAFNYLFHQVKYEMKSSSFYEALKDDVAVELGSLEIRLAKKDELQKMSARKITLKKIEWKEYLPPYLRSDTRALRRLMKAKLRVYGAIPLDEICVSKYFEAVSQVWKFDQETFGCRVVDVSVEPVKLTVGPAIISACVNCFNSDFVPVTNFEDVKSIDLLSDAEEKTCQMKIILFDKRDPLIIRCSSINQATQLASLIDGYCFLRTNGKEQVWSPYKSSPDYATLEEIEGIEQLPLINNPAHTKFSCSKATEANSSLPPFASTPDLLSNAQPVRLQIDTSSCISVDKFIISNRSVSSAFRVATVTTSVQTDSTPIVAKQLNLEQMPHLQPQSKDYDADWMHREDASRVLMENCLPSPKKCENIVNSFKITHDSNSKQFGMKISDRQPQEVDDYEWLRQEEAKRVLMEDCSSPKKCDNFVNVFKYTCDSVSKTQVTEPSNIPAGPSQQLKADQKIDLLYQSTTSLVQSICDLNSVVQTSETDGLIKPTTAVGLKLKALIKVVQSEISSLPPQTLPQSIDKMEAAQEALKSDLVHLTDAMKLVLHYSPTDLALKYRQEMWKLGKNLAKDSKKLFDVIDMERKRQDLASQASSSNLSSSPVSDLFAALSSQANASCDN